MNEKDMPHSSTLVEALEAARGSAKGITYIEGEENERTVAYNGLYDRALRLLHHMQAKGITPGAQLILLLNGNEEILDAFWAAILGGIIPVPLAPGIRDEHRMKVSRVFRKLSNPFLYTTAKGLEKLMLFMQESDLQAEIKAIQPRTMLVDDIDDMGKKGRLHRAHPDDLAFIQFSSGSTSEPAGVMLTHRNLLTNIRGIIESSSMHAGDVFLSWMPLTHDMGMIGFHLTPVVRGCAQYLMPTDVFVRRPMLWLGKAAAHAATIICSPNFGYRHLLRAFNAQKAQGLDLSNVRLVFNGAEPISVGLCE